jgi:hypothetical protein
MDKKYYILGIFNLLLRLILRLFFGITGYIIVPIALLFSKKGTRPDRPCYWQGCSHYIWEDYQLPKWAWAWGNDKTGTWGDDGYMCTPKRRMWAKLGSFWSNYVWLAIRNPAYNVSTTGIVGYDRTHAIDDIKYISNYSSFEHSEFTLTPSKEARHTRKKWLIYFAVQRTSTFLNAYHFEIAYGYGKDKNKGFVFEIGNKIYPEHNKTKTVKECIKQSTPAYCAWGEDECFKWCTSGHFSVDFPVPYQTL